MEKLKINPITPIVFKKNILKVQWLKGNMPSVQYGIYGGKLTKSNISLEHINCKCFGGKTKLSNLALATQEMNNLRGNKPLKDFLNSDIFLKYIKQFENIELEKFSGKDYVKALIKTVIDVLESGK